MTNPVLGYQGHTPPEDSSAASLLTHQSTPKGHQMIKLVACPNEDHMLRSSVTRNFFRIEFSRFKGQLKPED